MSVQSIGSALGNRERFKGRRTHQPVRRNSYERDEREHRIWRPFNPKEKWARLKAAEIYDRENKEAGHRNGPIGHVGLEILRALYGLVDHKTGRLEPSIEWMTLKLRRSRAAVVAALARLREHGFLDWIRRCETIEAEGPGPRVKQITNAYWFALPEKAAKWFRKVMAKSPTPDDESQRRTDDASASQAMLDRLSLPDQAREIAGDGIIGDILARIGASLERSASSPSGQNPGRDSI